MNAFEKCFKHQRTRTALMEASKNGHLDVVNRLLDLQGMDVNIRGDEVKQQNLFL